MTQEPKKLINLSVHESADPNQISLNANTEASGLNDLNDSVHDDKNADVPTPGLYSTSDEIPTGSQINTANLNAG